MTVGLFFRTVATVSICVEANALHGQSVQLAYNGMSTPSAGYSSADPSTVYGALLSVTKTGTLGSVGLSLYNGSASGGSIVAGTMQLSIYDASQGTPLGGAHLPLLASVSIPLNFSASPLLAGSYALLTTGDLSSQKISLTPKVLVTQRFELTQGSATRFGIAALRTAPTEGFSTGHYFVSNFQNAPGFYSGADGLKAFPLYQMTVVPEPESCAVAVGLVLVGWSLWRRSR